MKQHMELGHADAQKAIEVIKNEMLRRGKAAVIAVADAHGELLALLRVDGAPYTSIQIATNKAYTAARDRKPSRRSANPLAAGRNGQMRGARTVRVEHFPADRRASTHGPIGERDRHQPSG